MTERACASCRGPLPPAGSRGPARSICDDCRKIRAFSAAVRRIVDARPELEAVARRELGVLGPLVKLPRPGVKRPPIREKRRDVYIGHRVWQYLKSDARTKGWTISRVLRSILAAHYGPN